LKVENLPLVTVNILSFNRKDELRNTLTKVYEQDYKNIEVIVVDNASRDGSQEMVEAEFPDVILIKMTKNVGIAGWNEGFKIAKGEYVLVLDDDSFPVQSTISRGVEILDFDIKVAIVAYKVFNTFLKKYETDNFFSDSISFIGCGALLRRSHFILVGEFSKDLFIYHHEIDFSIRCLASGYRIIFCSEGLIIHNLSKLGRGNQVISPLINKNRYYYYYRNLSFILIKYFSRGREILFLRLFFNNLLVAFFYPYKKEFLKVSFYDIIKYFYYIKNVKVEKGILIFYSKYYGLINGRYLPKVKKSAEHGKKIIKYVKIYLNNIIAYSLLKTLKIFLPTKKNSSGKILFINQGYFGDIFVSSYFFDIQNVSQSVFVIRDEYLSFFSKIFPTHHFIGIDQQKYHYNLIYKIKILKTVRTNNFTECFNLNFNKASTSLFEIAILSGARKLYSLGVLSSRIVNLFIKKLLNNFNKTYISNNNYFQSLKLMFEDVYPNIKWKNSLDSRLTYSFLLRIPLKNFTMPRRPYITIAPISDHHFYDWSFSLFYSLIMKVIKKKKYEIVLLGKQDERNQLENLCINNKSIYNFSGQTSLMEAAVVINSSILFIGNDSGLTHLAKALGKKFIGFIGGYHFGVFFPYLVCNTDNYIYREIDCFGCERNCIFENPECVNDIDSDFIINKIEEILHERLS